MPRPVTIFTGQWGDVPLKTLCEKFSSFGYDGLELACWGGHFDVEKALEDDAYLCQKRDLLDQYGLKCWAISNHYVGQAICDPIDERHRFTLPGSVWGDGKEDGVRRRAVELMKNTAQAASTFGAGIVNGFTGSPIWNYLFYWRPDMPQVIEQGYRFFAEMWNPILDIFDQQGVRFALEVHPTQIAFDLVTAEKAAQAVGYRPAFGFNYDPSHMGYQGVDYIAFIRRFSERIYHCHMKDVYLSPQGAEAGVFGGHLEYGDARRVWNFRSLGHGSIRFEEIIRTLNDVRYAGPLSVEWEDNGMDREFGACEALQYVRRLDFAPAR